MRFDILNTAKLEQVSVKKTKPTPDVLSTAITEKHIYSGDNVIYSSQENITYNPSDDVILLKPEVDVRLAGVTRGNYNIVYNFFNNVVGSSKIISISADGTEVELAPYGNTTFKSLYNLTNSDSKYIKELNLNFGKNKLYPIVGVSFENNEKVGLKTIELSLPTDIYNNKTTTFYPESSAYADTTGDINISTWVEIYDDDSTTTGRTANFDVMYDNATDLPYFKQEIDFDGYVVYHSTYVSYTSDGISTLKQKSKVVVDYFSNSLKNLNNIQSVIVKLSNPIPTELYESIPIIVYNVRDTYTENVLVYPTVVVEEVPDFSTPNFKINAGVYGKSSGTDFKTWNSLLDTNTISSQKIVDTYISESLGGVNINIDYSNFENFVKYSSAVERVNNFKYKLELIESYDSRITLLQHTSGPEAITNISQSLDRKSNVISGFDNFEKWLYYESTGSLYTHYTSSYEITPWPKQSTYPSVNYSVTSSQAEAYWTGLIDSASIFDAYNDSRLTQMIPISMVEDPLNNEYVLFVDMIGHHFDIIWSYINKITTIHDREEHPYDGTPNKLLYQIANSMGWELVNGKNNSELWYFTAGTDKFGNTPQSGSLPSKSHEQITYEVWRRIVNNLPYLLKTKGSARSVKALISTYGIPQSFLSIREYGGPSVNDVRPIWEHDKFVYHLRMDGNNYITVPWDNITDIDSVTYLLNNPTPIDSIELQFQQYIPQTTALLNKGTDFGVLIDQYDTSTTNGNIHFYLSGSNGYKSASIENVPIFDDIMNTLVLQRDISTETMTDDVTYTLYYKRNRKDRVSVSETASISINGSTESSYNLAWTGSGQLSFGKPFPTSNTPAIWGDTEYMSGSIQEIRYWAQPFEESIIDNHTLARNMYNGNSHTSSFFDLKFRFIPDSQIRTDLTASLSQHPNQQITTTELGYELTASLFNFESDDLIGVTDEYYTAIPSAGANNIMNNKVRIEESHLTGILDPDNKKELSQYDKAPVDTNQVGIYLSANSMYNEDIYNTTGYFEIDDYIGDPDIRQGETEINNELDQVRRDVFRKYSSRNLINTVIGILSRYDMSVFDQIKQTMPARVDYNSGILIEPHILERPKAKSKSAVSYTNPQYNTTIILNNKPLVGDYLTYDATISVITSGSLMATRNDYWVSEPIATISPFESSTYYFNNLITSENTWITSSNGYWNYNPIGVSITNSRPSRHAKKTMYIYETAWSASMNLPTSSYYIPAEVSTDDLPLAQLNQRYDGCKMTSDSLTTNSPDTPDGKPVIEVFAADSNVLIYTSQTGNTGNLIIDSNTGVSMLSLDDLVVGGIISNDLLKQYQSDRSEFRQEIERLTNIETLRRAEFDRLYNEQTKK